MPAFIENSNMNSTVMHNSMLEELNIVKFNEFEKSHIGNEWVYLFQAR
jgi:hypothetical protein